MQKFLDNTKYSIILLFSTLPIRVLNKEMDIKREEKVAVIQQILTEKYSAENIMRERTLKFTLWILGYLIGFFGLLLAGKFDLELFTKILLTIVVSLTGYISYYFISSIKSGFKKNRKIIIKLENALMLYSKDVYLDGETLYPIEYKQEIEKTTPFFRSLYIPLIFIHIILGFYIWKDTIIKCFS